ncbi:MAG TPA: sigma-54 dependent transcriptional regulator [Bryobacteraceae bacterium]|nr:sigma-54 dependent transcriptional regulator [Bryobacteraceae bacterium]
MLPGIKLVAIDDTPASLELVSEALQQDGLTIFTCTDPEEGLDLIYQEHPQIVLLDLMMPKLNGLQVLERVVEFDPAIDVILMTAHYSTETAVEAIQKGASDYLNKPISIPALRVRVEKLLVDARRRQRALALDGELVDTARFEGMIGRSPLMWDLFARIRRVAPHYRSALITGPTGTGKDLVAKALHQLSPANAGRFVTCNCSAVVETLFESELFGYVKGAFTGAAADKMGLMEFAHGGTLFLDEIGDMPLSTQAKLLRALQNQEVTRVGSVTPRKVDVRVIAATNRDVQDLIAQKQFREDLYYRLAMVELRTPPLSDRLEDLPLLEKFLLDRFATQFNKEIRGLTRRAQIVLARHSWPGNIRELENALGNACMMAISDMIDVEDLPASLRQSERGVSAPAGNSNDVEHLADALAQPAVPPAVSFDEHEKVLVSDALTRSNGNQSEAARMLRISRDRLRYKMAKYNLR